MAVKKLNLSNFLNRVGVRITELVRQDSLKSIWQDNKKGGKY